MFAAVTATNRANAAGTVLLTALMATRNLSDFIAGVECLDNPEVYLADKAGAIGVCLAIFFAFIRYIDFKGMLADWRSGQKALTKLADDVADIARSIETQNSRYVDDVHRLKTSLDRIQTKLDQMVDR